MLGKRLLSGGDELADLRSHRLLLLGSLRLDVVKLPVNLESLLSRLSRGDEGLLEILGGLEAELGSGKLKLGGCRPHLVVSLKELAGGYLNLLVSA